MAMKRCPVCGERYSDTYKDCPFCEEEEYWEDEPQEPARRPILREGSRSSSRGRSSYGIVTPILIVLIVLMALLLIYLLYGDKIAGRFSKDPDDSGKTDIQTPAEPPSPKPGTTPALDPGETEEPDSSGSSSGTDTPNTDASGTGTPDAGTPDAGTPDAGTPDTGTMPEGNGGTSSGNTGTSAGGSGSGGMSYASAAELPRGLTLNKTDFTRSISETPVKLRVSGGAGTYTWISEDPSIATVGSDGTVTPVAAGTTHVVVTDGSKKAICIVRVTSAKSTTPSTPTSGGSTPSSPSTTPSSGGSLRTGKAVVINGGNGVRVRSGPGTSYVILASIPNGGSVQIVSSAGNDWYEITFTAVGGVTTTGYMKGEFLSNS